MGTDREDQAALADEFTDAIAKLEPSITVDKSTA